VVLFKAKNAGDKDGADFTSALPLLTSAGTAWLRGMLERLHPGHAWIEAL
jgi:hypothetical protein